MTLLQVPSDDWLGALASARAQGFGTTLVTILETEGSAPREGGTKMLVTSDGQTGSIGGGHLELKALEKARVLLADAAARPQIERYALGPALGQCCGGSVTLLFEPFAAAAWNVWIFGAGHVGKALVHQLAGLPLRAVLADARPEQFPDALPANCTKLVESVLEDAVKDVPPGAAALVMTHSHDLDLILVERLLRRGDLAYVGLIGSASKRKRFEARLSAKGVDWRKLVCPIGLPEIDDKHPHAIAIGVAAQLLKHRAASTEAVRPAPELTSVRSPR
ncbi:MAG: xanthine dehydrogenase accessory protein XdhC [Magnetospirillum sp.]|nr:xanthine dehydrogenase accessory protein XdhC [Magnetospirillum sp.]